MTRSTLSAMLLLISVVARDAVAQRRAAGQQPSSDPPVSQIHVIARLGSKTYSSNLPGSCKHEPAASIYDVPAALWTVEASGAEGSAIKQLNLTWWRPKNGAADQISLSLDAGSKPTRIDVNPRGKPVGSGRVRLTPGESGGKFELTGKDAKGTAVNLTISCPSFDAVEAAGG
jgi:hypothetical protein